MVTKEPSWGSFLKPNKMTDSFEPESELPIDQQLSNGQEELDLSKKNNTEQNEAQWGNFKTPYTFQGPHNPEEEENLSYLVRNITANASRIGEQVIGTPGNFEQMGKDIISNFPQITGILGYALSQLMGEERWKQMVNGSPAHENKMFPTSKELKEFSHAATGEYTKAKTQGEERFQEVVEDISSTLLTRRPANLKNIAVNNLGIPLSSNIVKNIVEDLGFGTNIATYSKLGTWSFLTLAGNINATQYASDLMNKGRNAIPQNLDSNVPRFQNRLQQVANNPYLLHADPRSALAREELAAIQRDLANGQVSIRSLMTTYDGVNAAKRNRGLFEFNKNDRDFARRAINQVRDAVRDEIMQSGVNYPQALQDWNNGIQAWATIHQSRAITNWIEDVAKGPYAKLLTGPAAGLFGIGSYAGFKAPLISIPAAGIIPPYYKVLQTAYRMGNDPNLSRYYWNAVLDAKSRNLPAFLNNYNKLNKKLDALEKKDKSKKK